MMTMMINWKESIYMNIYSVVDMHSRRNGKVVIFNENAESSGFFAELISIDYIIDEIVF